MSRLLRVAVLNDRYPTLFGTPRRSAHAISRRLFLPTHKISRRIESFTVMNTMNADLIHSFNRIPLLTGLPFVISFESHLPRYFGGEHTRLFALMRQRLAGPGCKRILAISEFARRIFLDTHKDSEEYAALEAKLQVTYPNVVLPDWSAEPSAADEPLRLLFVGAHFGRKGGAAAVRAAEIARQRNLPIEVHIVSSLTVGPSVWTDPLDPAFFEPYFQALRGGNVRFDQGLPNSEVVALMRKADFTILTTFSDTFGYSAIESMAVGTPVLATPQGALPEFVTDGENGHMVGLATGPLGEWIHIARNDKAGPAYADLYRGEIERIAEEIVDHVEPYCHDRARLAVLRQGARRTAEKQFDTDKIGPRLDQLYEECVRAQY